MKKILFVLILFTGFQISGNAQKAVGSQQDIKHFFKTKTLVVLDNNIFNVYNNAVKNGMQKAWYLTEFDFITEDEFQSKMNDPNYSFLIRTKVYPEGNENKVAYTFLSLLVGEKNKTFDQLPEICSMPLSYYGVEYEEYDYKMPTLLLFMQKHIEITRDNPQLNSKNILSYYNKNMSKIGNKTIYLTKEDLAPEVNSLSKIKKYYKGKVVITTKEEIAKHADNRDPNAIILHKVSPPKNYPKKDRCYKTLLGTADGTLYYFDYHKISPKKPDGMLKSDFKKLNAEQKK